MNNTQNAANIQIQFDVKNISSATRIIEVLKEEIIVNTKYHYNQLCKHEDSGKNIVCNQQIEKNVVQEVQEMIKQASDEKK